jgi:hypothetical protein
MKMRPRVNEVNEFLEIASDFEDPLEVIRESLSNAYDANATEVLITIRTGEQGSDIIIDDDGVGMSRRDLKSFFDLGNSRKKDSIGHKGHGTKIFYKSEEIVVQTSNGESLLRAVMDRPWQKLNDGQLPEYELTEADGEEGFTGTHIRIQGFKSGLGFEPSSLTYNKIHHYLAWKTIAGSTAHYFGDQTHSMGVKVDLDESIDDTRDMLVIPKQFKLPAEQLDPDKGKFPTERMCRHFGPTTLAVELPDGSTTTLEIIGMAGGKAARDELPTYGRHSAQFGVWLAKDHIKVERFNEAISADNVFMHFFFIANCQDFELSANREKIRNKSSAVFQAATEELDHYMSKVVEHPWTKEYLIHRKNAEIERRAESHADSIERRRSRVEGLTEFIPRNTTEVVAALERTNITARTPVRIADFSPAADINAIAECSGELYSASVCVSMAEPFGNESLSPLNTEMIICWEYGDLDVLRQLEREGYLGGEIEFDFEGERIIYDNGRRHEIEIIHLEERT